MATLVGKTWFRTMRCCFVRSTNKPETNPHALMVNPMSEVYITILFGMVYTCVHYFTPVISGKSFGKIYCIPLGPNTSKARLTTYE